MGTSEQARPDGRQRRWERHNRERRELIIAAAVTEVEAHDPGAEIHLEQIARRAGMGRSVVYRHFEDRADLDRAVQVEVVDALAGRLVEQVSLDGTIPDIVRRVVGTYVDWAVAHPALHHVALREDGENGALEAGLGRIAAQVCEVIVYAVDLLRVDVSEDERAALDPLIFGLVGAVFGAVRRWAAVVPPAPPAPVMVNLVSESVWYIIAGHARALGLVLERDQPVEDLLLASVEEPEDQPSSEPASEPSEAHA